MSVAPADDEPVDAPDGGECEAEIEDNTEAIAAGISACELELRYFEEGSKFLNYNYVLLGYHVTDSGQVVGELDDDVQSALNILAIEVARRMTRIMRNDLPTNPTGKAADLA